MPSTDPTPGDPNPYEAPVKGERLVTHAGGSPPPALEVLPRILGPFDAVMIVVGSIIGSGIFLKIKTGFQDLLSA